jgi:hypothetical protein
MHTEKTYTYIHMYMYICIINKNIPKTMMIHTDSRINLDSLKNMGNWNYLIEAIRKKTIAMEKENWYIEYTWVKAHAGHERNELADKLAKEATRDSKICYNKIPKSEIEHQERETSMEKWQQLWNNTTKGTITKEFFPKIKDRLKMKITLTHCGPVTRILVIGVFCFTTVKDR